ncbi:S-layer homology domain-containing protein [Rothia sp. L_38]|uniref:S-layer homology domain-containing protein n=1 Tax=Rothia sp. L_38 TaxID=3422315 RepID=UPI003D6B7EEB
MPVVGGIRSLWATNPARFGSPLSPEQALSPVTSYQPFSNGIIIWNLHSGSHFYPGNPHRFIRTGPRNLLRDANKHLGSQDALLIGDSQIGDPSLSPRFWVGQGFAQAGYRPHFYSWGGIGVHAVNQYHPSYFDSVINNARALPLGSPGIVYIQGSGNDLWTGRSYQDTAEGLRTIIRLLRELYPHSLIMLSEVVSRRIPEQTNRHQLSDHLAAVGKQEGIHVVPNRFWITDKGVAHLLQDSVHLSPAGHNALAPHLAAWIRWATGKGFTDVFPNTGFYQEINWMRTSGISTGWEDGTYRPWATMNRDAMAAFFYRLAGSPHFIPPTVSPFRDITPYSNFYKEITWLRTTGITTGWTDGTYRPLTPVTREALASFLYRRAGSPAFTPPRVSPFIDVSPANEHYKAISWMRSMNYARGWSDGTYRPQEAVTRDAIAAFLYRMGS